jgi:hypothetical protein
MKYIILFLFLTTSLFSQKVTTSIDTTKNKIGAQFNLTFKTTVDSMATVSFPKVKNFGLMEVIRDYKIDTIKKDNTYELIKKYGLTQFDSGRFQIPRMAVLINKKPVFSDSITVEVQNVKVDTLKQKMYDIKPIIEVPTETNYWDYLAWLLLLVGIAALIYFGIKKFQKKKIEEETFKTPIEKATNLLNNLEKKALWQNGNVKEYYSELTDIARNYIEEALDVPAMESTTAELIAALKQASITKKMKLSQETILNLESVLKQADLVKFAKSKPLDFEIEADKTKIQKSIITLDKSIPIVVANDELAQFTEAQRQEKIKAELKKKRKTRITITLVCIAGILFFTTLYFVFTKGFTYVKDTLIGHPTKELLESEWVTSQYGNPGILLETPKVLKRMDAEKSVPKETMALIKEMQMFAFGSFTDDFYIMVSTSKLKTPTEIDLTKVMEGVAKMMELQGASNIFFKQEEFNTGQNLKGQKAFGTMLVTNPVNQKTARIYYEILFFKQEQGLQQIMIFRNENDTYGKEIMERVMKSVELKEAN